MASYTEKFFEDLNAAPLWDVAVSIKRSNPLPIDKDAVVHGVNGLNTLCAGATSYPGQIVAVVIDAVMDGEIEVSPERIDLYYLGPDKVPHLVTPEVEIPEAKEYTGDNKTIEVVDNVIALRGASSAANGTLPMVGDDGKLTWKTLEDIGAGDGNDNTTYKFTALTKGEGESVEVYGISIKEYLNGQPAVDEEGVEKVAQEIYFDVYTKSEVDTKLGTKADATALDNYYTKEAANNLLDTKANTADVYVKAEVDTAITDAVKVEADKVSSLIERVTDTEESIETINGEITTIKGTLDEKANTTDVYTKSQVFTKEEVKAEIANVDHLKREIVTILPEVENADENTIYMIRESDLTSGDVYKEYMLIEGKFELIGDSAIILNDYYTKTQTDNFLHAKANASEVYTKTETDAAIDADVLVETNRAKTVEEALGGRIDGVASNLAALTDEDGVVTKNTTDITALTKTVTDNKTAQDELAETVEGHTTEISEIKASLDGKADKTTTEQSIAAIESTLVGFDEENTVANAMNGKADKATTLAGYGITDAYTSVQTDAAITEKIKEMMGDESAADVLGFLNDYKKANDREIWGNEFVTNNTVDGTYAPDYSGESRIDTLETDLTNLETEVGKKANTSDLASYVTADTFNTYKTEVENKFLDQDEVVALINGKDYDGKIEEVSEAVTVLTGRVDAAEGKITTLEEKVVNVESNAQANILEGIKLGTNETVITLAEKIATIPVATEAEFGVVKSSNAENNIAVAADGSMSVNSVNVDKLVQTGNSWLVLNGGSSNINSTQV